MVALEVMLHFRSNAFLQVERRGDALEPHAKLHQGERHLGLNADNDRVGPAQADHLRDVSEGARGKRVHHVERSDVHDYTA